VLCILPYDTEEEAIRIANDTPYGLSTTSFGDTHEHASRVGKRIRAGNVHLNGASLDVCGSWRLQAVGPRREWAPSSFAGFLEVKSVFGADRTRRLAHCSDPCQEAGRERIQIALDGRRARDVSRRRDALHRERDRPNDSRLARASTTSTATIWNKAGEVGLLCTDIPRNTAGSAATRVTRRLVAEEMGAPRHLGASRPRGAHSILAHYVLNYGSEQQKRNCCREWRPANSSARSR